MADDTVEGYFTKERAEELGMTDEMNKEFRRIVTELMKKDQEEQGKRIADKAIVELTKKYPNWKKDYQRKKDYQSSQ